MRATPHVLGGSADPYSRRPRSSPQAAQPSDGVGSAEIEAALADLGLALCRDRCHAVVAAPPGPGKTLLLRALEERLAGSLRVVQVRSPTARENEIFAQILGELGEKPGRDAEAKLLDVIRGLASRDSALLLLICDAHAWQAATLRRLGDLATASAPGLRLALVVAVEGRSDRDAVAEVVSALGVGAEKVVLYARRQRQREAVRVRPRPEALPPLRAVAGSEISRATRLVFRTTAVLGISLALLGLYRFYEPSVSGAVTRGSPAAGGAALPVRSPAPAEAPLRPIRVSLNAQPWARIEVDGREVGVTPLAGVLLAPGLHRFQARFPDGRVIQRTLRVDATHDHFSFP